MDRKIFMKRVTQIKKNKIFDFVKSILENLHLSPETYGMRAKILIPYIREVFPDQIKTVNGIQMMDCTCNFGDCFRYYAREKLPAFKWAFSACSRGHASYEENETTFKIYSYIFKGPNFETLIKDELKVAHNRECRITNPDKSGCDGRTSKRLINAGEKPRSN